MLKVTHDRYSMATRTTVDGTVTREADKPVDAEYVRRYIEARGFFELLSGTEVHRRTSGGGIHVTATSPDGVTIRETVFTPIYSALR